MGSRKAEIPPSIPEKLSFRIGEVAKIVGVASSVLRFWETQFPSLRPEKSRTNQRVYSRRHVEKILEVQKLLYEQGYTIQGAKRALRGGGGTLSAALAQRIRKEVEELLRLCAE